MIGLGTDPIAQAFSVGLRCTLVGWTEKGNDQYQYQNSQEFRSECYCNDSTGSDFHRHFRSSTMTSSPTVYRHPISGRKNVWTKRLLVASDGSTSIQPSSWMYLPCLQPSGQKAVRVNVDLPVKGYGILIQQFLHAAVIAGIE